LSLLRFLGLGGKEKEAPKESQSETATVRKIAARLERLDPETAKFLAAFAYVLARVAHADLSIDSDETSAMERIVSQLADLAPEEASLVVEIAKSQARLLGGTENYVVTREFRKISTREQRGKLLECLYAVAAADGSITGHESTEIVLASDQQQRLGIQGDPKCLDVRVVVLFERAQRHRIRFRLEGQHHADGIAQLRDRRGDPRNLLVRAGNGEPELRIDLTGHGLHVEHLLLRRAAEVEALEDDESRLVTASRSFPEPKPAAG
jgi:uncharacterized tellurite resistance protein B-like protein